MKALSNEARLMMVDTLKGCECCVGDLAKAVGLDISTVSKHLAVLSSVGIVAFRKIGNTVCYRLNAPCVLELFSCCTEVIDRHASGGASDDGSVSRDSYSAAVRPELGEET